MSELIQFLLVIAALLFNSVAQARVVVPSDSPYYLVQTKNAQYIFDATSREFIDQLIAYNSSIFKMYEKSFNWRLDERVDVILTSPSQQVANAYATINPNLKAVWFPSGAGMLEEMAESSWLLTLAAHETAHLYQFNSKRGINETLVKVFGNTATISLFNLPIFLHPNLLTPVFLMEGNAVLNESRLNMGGRLHSGEKRALVLAQIRAGEIDPTRLINEDLRFPFGEEPYLQGGYFSAFLAAKYGIEKTNSFFAAQGGHYLWPLILNDTFRTHFGESYPQLIREYVRELEGLAKNQRSLAGDALISATWVTPFNHDAKRVFFLGTDGKEPSYLYVYDKDKKKLSQQRLDLPLGKVFFDGATPSVAASRQHNLHKIEYSLYREGGDLDPRYRGQIVSDQRAGKTAALDAANSWLDPHLLINGEFYDVAHSNPVLDDEGNVHYFRQNGTQRILYRNREPVFKFEGFYGKLTEVTTDGTIYFIANTDNGSSLYRYHKNEIQRVIDSDQVVDARMIGSDEFLVTEIGNFGHKVFIAKTVVKNQYPSVYAYGFSSENLIPDQSISKDQVRAEEKPYNGLLGMRFSSLEAATTFDSSGGLSGAFNASFSDPLEYHHLSTAYSTERYRTEAAVAYSYTRFITDVFAKYVYQDLSNDNSINAGEPTRLQSFALGLGLPLLHHKRWDARASVAAVLSDDEKKETISALTILKAGYSVPTQIGFFPWRDFSVTLTHSADMISTNKERSASLIKAEYTHGFPKEIFSIGHLGLAWSEARDIPVEYSSYSLSDTIRINRLTPFDKFDVQSAAYARIELHKVFDILSYSARFPIGLNRASGFVIGQGIALDRQSMSYPANIFEWGYGADLELLVFHSLPMRLRYLQAVDTADPNRGQEKRLSLSFQRDF